MEPRRITIGDHVYQLRPWAYADGRKWLYRFGQLAAHAGAASKVESDEAAIGKLLEALGEDRFAELCNTVEQYTDLVQVSGGVEKVQPLSSVSAAHMRRRYLDLVKLLKAHVEEEFGDFFAGLGVVLGDRGVKETD
ncbi:MAG: phage tail assembly chaperone [Acidobacteriota bacterium]